MCHSSDRWTFWSRRQPDKTETTKRSEAVVPSVEPVADARKDEPVRRERELDRVS